MFPVTTSQPTLLVRRPWRRARPTVFSKEKEILLNLFTTGGSDNFSTQYPVPSTQYPVPSTQYPVPSTQYPVPSTQYPVPSTQYPVPSTQYPVARSRDIEYFYDMTWRRCVIILAALTMAVCLAGSSFAEVMPPEEVSVTISADALPPEEGRYTGPCMGDEAFGRTWLDRTHAYITGMLCQPSVWF